MTQAKPEAALSLCWILLKKSAAVNVVDLSHLAFSPHCCLTLAIMFLGAPYFPFFFCFFFNVILHIKKN